MTITATWVGYPKSWTKGRARPIQYIVLHYTAGSEGPSSAEAGASYDKRRTDGTSTHYFTDSAGPPLCEVPPGDRSHAARLHGNEIGVQIEICGTEQTLAQWLDQVSAATLRTTAKLVAELCTDLALPARRMSVAEVRAAYYNAPGNRPKGICDHGTVTKAYPEDNGDHMDVGTAFPWDVFMKWVAEFMAPVPPIASGGTDMAGFFAIKDTAPVYVSDGFKRRHVELPEDLAAWQASTGAKVAYVEDEAALDRVAGPLWVPGSDTGGGVTPDAARAIARVEIAASSVTPAKG